MGGDQHVVNREQPVVAVGHPFDTVQVDPYSCFVFPNRIREERPRHGFATLLALSEALPEIPYIRLSKIERGEVFARADELDRIARVLHVPPRDLLIDVDAEGFDIASWAEPFFDRAGFDQRGEQLAILLAAALRDRRNRDRSLTLAVLDKQFGLAPVIVSRIENAQKTLTRWNAATLEALARIFGIPGAAALPQYLERQHASGALGPYLPALGNPEQRLARTRERIAALVAELEQPRRPATGAEPRSAGGKAALASVRLVPLFGTPLPGGLIAKLPVDGHAEAPASAGPRAFGLRVCRPTLGGGLPGSATAIVDPDRYPSADSIALVREGEHYRLLATTTNRSGALIGYSLSPACEVVIDDLDPADVAAVVAATFG